jgi:hypothetical protein
MKRFWWWLFFGIQILEIPLIVMAALWCGHGLSTLPEGSRSETIGRALPYLIMMAGTQIGLLWALRALRQKTSQSS